MGAEVAIALTLIGTGVQVASKIEEGKQTEKAGKAKEKELLKEKDRVAERGRRLRAAQRSRVGAAGIRAAGSPLQVQAESAIDSLLDQEVISAGARNIRKETRARARAALTSAIGVGIRGFGSAGFDASKLGLFGADAAESAETVGGLSPLPGIDNTPSPHLF